MILAILDQNNVLQVYFTLINVCVVWCACVCVRACVCVCAYSPTRYMRTTYFCYRLAQAQGKLTT